MPYREDIREDNFKSRIKDLERQLAEAMDYIKAIADDVQPYSALWAECLREWKPTNSWGRNAKGKRQ